MLITAKLRWSRILDVPKLQFDIQSALNETYIIVTVITEPLGLQ